MIAPLGLKEIPGRRAEQPGESVRICGMHLVGGCDSHPSGAANQGKTKQSYDDESCELCHFGNEKPVRNCG
jgi:hypothetical protein